MKRKIIESVLIICLGGMLLGSAMQSNKVEVAEEQIEISTEQEANIETEKEIETEQVATEIVVAETESEEEVVAVEEPIAPVETNENVEPSESTTTNADREPQRYEDITVEYLNSRLPCEYPRIYDNWAYDNWRNNFITTVGNDALDYACVHIRGQHHFIPASELQPAADYWYNTEQSLFENWYYLDMDGYVICNKPSNSVVYENYDEYINAPERKPDDVYYGSYDEMSAAKDDAIVEKMLEYVAPLEISR